LKILLLNVWLNLSTIDEEQDEEEGIYKIIVDLYKENGDLVFDEYGQPRTRTVYILRKNGQLLYKKYNTNPTPKYGDTINHEAKKVRILYDKENILVNNPMRLNIKDKYGNQEYGEFIYYQRTNRVKRIFERISDTPIKYDMNKKYLIFTNASKISTKRIRPVDSNGEPDCGLFMVKTFMGGSQFVKISYNDLRGGRFTSEEEVFERYAKHVRYHRLK